MIPRRRILIIYLNLSVLLLLLTGGGYWFFYQSRSELLERRNLRQTRTMGDNLARRLENLAKPVWSNVEPAGADKRSGDQLLERLESLHFVSRARESIAKSGGEPTLDLYFEPPHLGIEVSGTSRNVRLQLDKDDVFSSLFEDDFSHILVYRAGPLKQDSKGTETPTFQLITSHQDNHNSIVEMSELQENEKNSWSPELSLTRSATGYVQVAQSRYRIYSHPVMVPTEILLPFGKDSRYYVNKEEVWVIAGLVDESKLFDERMHISPHYGIVLLFCLLAVAFSLPLLRLKFMGRHDNLSTIDVLQLGLGLMFGCFVLCTGALYAYMFLVVSSYNENNLKRMSELMRQEFESELRPVVSFLHESAARAKGGDRDFWESQLSSFELMPKLVFSTAADGMQLNKWNANGLETPEINVADREYFAALKEGRAYKLYNEGQDGKPLPYWLEPVRSWTTDTFEVICAVPIIEAGEFRGILAANLQLPSLTNALPPPGQTFAITDVDGKVLFHGDPRRNLLYNFFDETNRTDRLRVMARARVSQTLHLTHMGDDYLCRMGPLMTGLPWSIINLSEKQAFREFYLAVLLQVTIWFLYYFFFIALMVGVFSLFVLLARKQGQFRIWYSPANVRLRTWAILCVLYIVLLTAQVILFAGAPLAAKAWVVFLGLACFASTVVILNASKMRSLEEENHLRESDWFSRNVHVLAFCMYTFSGLVLPMATFTNGAFQSVGTLFIKQGQLYTYEQIKARGIQPKQEEPPPYLAAFFDMSIVSPMERAPSISRWLIDLQVDQDYLLRDLEPERAFFWSRNPEIPRSILLNTDSWAFQCIRPALIPLRNGQPAFLLAGILIVCFLFLYTVSLFHLVRFTINRLYLLDAGLRRPESRDRITDMIAKGRAGVRHLVLGSPSPLCDRQELASRFGDQFLVVEDGLLWIDVKRFLILHGDNNADRLCEQFKRTIDQQSYRTVIVDEFDYVPSHLDPFHGEMERIKFSIAESLLSHQEACLFIFSQSHPGHFYTKRSALVSGDDSPGIKRDWVRLLKSFRIHGYAGPPLDGLKDIDEATRARLVEECGPFPQLMGIARSLDRHQGDPMTEFMERARGYYYDIWSRCSPEEKMLLFDLSRDGFVNSRNLPVLRLLVARSLVTAQGGLSLFSPGFRDYVLDEFSRDDVIGIEDSSGLSWSYLKFPLTVVLVAGCGFLYLTQPNLWQLLAGFLSTVSVAVLPSVFKLLGMFARRGSRS